jgi:uncharacterized protein YbjT (DUF2867 family)
MTARSPYDTLVTIYGGSGFLGRHLVRALAKRHYRIRVAVRRPELANHLQPLGRVGQIHAVQTNLRNAASVEAAARRVFSLSSSATWPPRLPMPSTASCAAARSMNSAARK